MRNENKKTFIIITEWLTILGTLLACFFFLHSQISELRSDMKSINIALNERIDQTHSRIDQENTRIDQMYAVLLESLKEKK